MSEEELYKLLDELSKSSTTSLALNVMELTEETLEKDKEIERLNNRIEKAVEYITNTEDMCYYGKCNDGDLLIEVEEDFKNDLLNILNGRSDE